MSTRRSSLLSRDWYRVARLRPRLRAGVGVTRHVYRDETWHVAADPVSGRHHRFNALAWRIVGACDGKRSVDELWLACVAELGDAAPSQAEVISLLSQAIGAQVLAVNVSPDAEVVAASAASRRGKQRAARLNPLAFRVGLWNPDAALERAVPWAGWLFAPFARRLGWTIALAGLLLFMLNATALGMEAARLLVTPQGLLLLWLAYPLVKALHEAAHGIALKSFGAPVRETGITLLFLTPVPFVDASAAATLADKRERMTVALAGILVEAVLAVGALVLWLALEPGLARDAAFAVAFIGAASTLLVNGNPLVRFDGYYALADALEIPNLAARSSRFWADLAKHRLLGVSPGGAPVAAAERVWLAGYAPASLACRTVLLAGFVLIIAEAHLGLAVIVGLIGFVPMFGKPLLATLRYLAASPQLADRRVRASAIALALAAIASVALFALPLPHVSRAAGLIWLPEAAMVRPGVDGFVEALLVSDGDAVRTGTPIVQLRNEELHVELARVRSLLKKNEVERATVFSADALRTRLADDERERLIAEEARLQARIAMLVVRAQSAGRIAIRMPQDLPERFVAQGELLAHVIGDEAPLVRALVRNEDVALVRDRTARVSVVTAFGDADPAPARIERAVPQASAALPSAALGELAGGPIAIDPSDGKGLTAREPRFEFDLRLAAAATEHIGARVLVTFHHPDATFAEQAIEALRRAFLRHFER